MKGKSLTVDDLDMTERRAPFGHVSMSNPDDEGRTCCMGAALRGSCTCWEAQYSAPQLPEVDGLEPVVRPDGMCDDCACRPDSPERRGDDAYASNWADVQLLVAERRPFYCHDGMRRMTGSVHPDGRRRPAGGDSYAPAVGRSGRPLKADGTPAFFCAGFAALLSGGA